MKRDMSFYHLLVVAVFACILLTFSVFYLTDATIEGENALTDTCFDGTVIEGEGPFDVLLRAVYQNEFSLDLIRENAYRLFGIASNSNILVGEHDFLFEIYDEENQYHYLADYLGNEYFSAKETAALTAALCAERDAYAANGMDYLLVVIPNAQTVYSEYMPPYLGDISAETRLTRLAAELEKGGFHSLLDLTEALSAHKADGLLYSNTENSLNALGLYYSYLAVCEWYGDTAMREVTPISRQRLSFYQHTTPGKELAQRANLADVVQNKSVSLSGNTALNYRFMDSGRDLANTIIIKNQQAGAPNLKLHFSRTWDCLQSQPYFSNTFTRVAYLQQPNTENGGGVEYGVAVRFVYENELSQLLPKT